MLTISNELFHPIDHSAIQSTFLPLLSFHPPSATASHHHNSHTLAMAFSTIKRDCPPLAPKILHPSTRNFHFYCIFMKVAHLQLLLQAMNFAAASHHSDCNCHWIRLLTKRRCALPSVLISWRAKKHCLSFQCLNRKRNFHNRQFPTMRREEWFWIESASRMNVLFT